jgi:hypothetical protein
MSHRNRDEKQADQRSGDLGGGAEQIMKSAGKHGSIVSQPPDAHTHRLSVRLSTRAGIAAPGRSQGSRKVVLTGRHVSSMMY